MNTISVRGTSKKAFRAFLFTHMIVALVLFSNLALANFQGNAAHTGYSPLDGPENVSTVEWIGSASGYPIVNGSSVAVGGGQVYGYSCGSDNNSYVVCFDRATGTHIWTSLMLDTGNSCSYGSWSSPVYDPNTGDVFFGTGSTLYRLDAFDGAILWSQPLPGEIINSSPLVTADLVAVHSSGGFSPTNSYIAVFTNDATGTPLWQHQHGGGGANSPAYFSGVVYDLINVSGQGSEMRAYDAVSGATIWSSSDLPLTNDWFGGISFANGYLYAQTYGFGGDGELVKVDASDGSHDWILPVPAGDATPIVGDGRVIVVGGYGVGTVSAVTIGGATDWTQPGVGGGASWQVSAFQAGQYVYVAPGNTFGSAPLYVLSASDGFILNQSIDSMSGTPVVDGLEVIVPAEDGSVYCFSALSAIEDWQRY